MAEWGDPRHQHHQLHHQHPASPHAGAHHFPHHPHPPVYVGETGAASTTPTLSASPASPDRPRPTAATGAAPLYYSGGAAGEYSLPSVVAYEHDPYASPPHGSPHHHQQPQQPQQHHQQHHQPHYSEPGPGHGDFIQFPSAERASSLSPQWGPHLVRHDSGNSSAGNLSPVMADGGGGGGGGAGGGEGSDASGQLFIRKDTWSDSSRSDSGVQLGESGSDVSTSGSAAPALQQRRSVSAPESGYHAQHHHFQPHQPSRRNWANISKQSTEDLLDGVDGDFAPEGAWGEAPTGLEQPAQAPLPFMQAGWGPPVVTTDSDCESLSSSTKSIYGGSAASTRPGSTGSLGFPSDAGSAHHAPDLHQLHHLQQHQQQHQQQQHQQMYAQHQHLQQPQYHSQHQQQAPQPQQPQQQYGVPLVGSNAAAMWGSSGFFPLPRNESQGSMFGGSMWSDDSYDSLGASLSQISLGSSGGGGGGGGGAGNGSSGAGTWSTDNPASAWYSDAAGSPGGGAGYQHVMTVPDAYASRYGHNPEPGQAPPAAVPSSSGSRRGFSQGHGGYPALPAQPQHTQRGGRARGRPRRANSAPTPPQQVAGLPHQLSLPGSSRPPLVRQHSQDASQWHRHGSPGPDGGRRSGGSGGVPPEYFWQFNRQSHSDPSLLHQRGAGQQQRLPRAPYLQDRLGAQPPSPLRGGTSSGHLGGGTRRGSPGSGRRSRAESGASPGGGSPRPESPLASKARHKDFLKILRDKEKESYQEAMAFAESVLNTLPPQDKAGQVKVLLDLGDLAKRENHVEGARSFFARAADLLPHHAQVWLEASRLEEECGEMDHCAVCLQKGLTNCPYIEPLMVKSIKHQERMGHMWAVRDVLSKLCGLETEKHWKVINEGAMFEARGGRVDIARRICKFLMLKVSSHGPVYSEALKLDERTNHLSDALEIAELGLAEVARYGPLWFSALRIREKLRVNIGELRVTVHRALRSVSRELVWKVWYEAAQIEARANNLALARAAYANAVRNCPDNLRWKVWLGSARTELAHGHPDIARTLLHRALLEVPKKTRAIVLLECARLEEHDGNIDRARDILGQGCREARHEWKIFLEAVLLEHRAGNLRRALEKGQEALATHPGTGRLWAVLIQLRQQDGEEAQLAVFRQALNEVPKSGEVWCEGARIKMNPLARSFSLREARRYLDFAVQFTPQYGDSFIEYARLCMLESGPTQQLNDLLRLCVNADPNYGALWCHCKSDALNDARQVLTFARSLLEKELQSMSTVYTEALLRSNPGAELLAETDAASGLRPGWPAAHLGRLSLRLCAICKAPLRNHPVVQLSCNHLFHERCALAFSLNEGTAPGVSEERGCPVCAEPWCVVEYYEAEKPPSRRGSLPGSDAAVAARAASGKVPGSPRPAAAGRNSAPGAAAPPPAVANAPGDLGLELLSVFGAAAGPAQATPGPSPQEPPAEVPQDAAPATQPPPQRPHTAAAAAPASGWLSHPGCQVEDFATGLVELNRAYRQADSLDKAHRQRILFGSDFVVP